MRRHLAIAAFSVVLASAGQAAAHGDVKCDALDEDDAGHALAGAALAERWGLPGPVIEAVAFHHDPLGSASDRPDALAAVHVGEGLTAAMTGQPGRTPDAAYLARIGAAERLDRWRDAVASCRHGGGS